MAITSILRQISHSLTLIVWISKRNLREKCCNLAICPAAGKWMTVVAREMIIYAKFELTGDGQLLNYKINKPLCADYEILKIYWLSSLRTVLKVSLLGHIFNLGYNKCKGDLSTN